MHPLVSALLRPRSLLSAVLGAVAVGLMIGIPTDVVPNPWFQRMTPTEPEQYFFWALTSLLTGLLLASYLLPAPGGVGGASAGGGLLGVLAVGCPVCNKAVVALLGTSGALSVFGPLQPVIGSLGLLLVAVALTLRLRAFSRGCAVPDPLPAE